MKRFKADLHIHTALSPCAEEEMTPPAIVDEAISKGIEMIAICDHNTAGNSASVQQAGKGKLSVIAGMEITSMEDVHVLGLFPCAEAACAAAVEAQATLPEIKINGGKFGRQLLLDAAGNIIGSETKMLAASTAFNLYGIIQLIKRHRGIAVAAHVNRPSFSVLRQLGFFPKDAGFDAIEIFTRARSKEQLIKEHSYGLPVFSSSDSHFLADIGSCITMLEMFEPTFNELELAIKGIKGRKCLNA